MLPQQNYRRATWKNGLGHTDEIAIYPPGSDLKRGDFAWRLSSAQISQNSPFSTFPDHDRILIILKGKGMRLAHRFVEGEPEEAVELPPLEPYEFPGDVASHCHLLGGPVVDFSVFVRKAEVEAASEVVALGPGEEHLWDPSGHWNFIYAVDDTLKVILPSGKTETLKPGDTFQVNLEEAVSGIRICAARGEAHLIQLSLYRL